MDVVNTNPTSLASLVSIVNSKVESKLLTDSNYEVLSVKPLTSSTSKHNTVAEIRVDLGLNAPTKILTANDRYSRRSVEFTRIDLKDIAKFRGLTINAKGQIVSEATDIASVIELLGAAIAEAELKLIPLSDAFIVKAVENSLGYVGAITFKGVGTVTEPEDGDEEEPTGGLPTVDAKATAIVGNSLFLTESDLTPHIVDDLTYTGAYSAQAGTLDITLGGIWDQTGDESLLILPVALGDVSFAQQIDVLKGTNPDQLALKVNGDAIPVSYFDSGEIFVSQDGRYLFPVLMTTSEQTYTFELSLDGFVTSTKTTVRVIPNMDVIEPETNELKSATIRTVAPITGDLGTEFTLISDYDNTSKVVNSQEWLIEPSEYFTEVRKDQTATTMEVTYRVAKDFEADTAVTVTNRFNTHYQATLTFTALAAGSTAE